MRVWITTLSVLFACHAVAQQKEDPKLGRKQAAELRKLAGISTIVKGRCVDGETGAPLAGVEVDVHAWGRSTEEFPDDLKKPKPVTTGADGRFEIRCLATSGYQVSFDAQIEGRWPRTGRWRHLVPSEVEDVGDVRLYPGVYVEGILVNTDGEPVADASIGVDDLRLYLGCEDDVDDTRDKGARLREVGERGLRAFHVHANSVRWCHTDENGRFRSRVALPPGTWRWRMSRNRFQLQGDGKITIPKDGEMQPVRVVVEEMPYMAGVVVDADTGKPIKGISLEALLPGSGRMATGYSKADGTFKIYRSQSSGDSARISVSRATAYEAFAGTKAYEWGARDIRIELQRAPSVELTVVEKGTGKPVEEFSIRAYATSGRMSSLDRRRRQSGKHEGGRLQVTGVRRGPGRVEVVPKDPKLLFAGVDVVGGPDMKPLRIEVERLVPMMVQVLDADGAPKARAIVKVIVPGNYEPIRGPVPVNNPRGDGMNAFSSNPNQTFDTEIYRATTDEGGQCIVYGISGREDLVLGVPLDLRNMHREAEIAFGPNGNGHTIKLPKKK